MRSPHNAALYRSHVAHAVMRPAARHRLRICCCLTSAWTLSGRGRPLSQAGTTSRRTVSFLDRAAAPQVMRGR